MASSHIIDIEECETGTYTKVRKLLNKKLGSPEAWDYDKPLFTVDCSGDQLDELQAKLGDLSGIKFLPDHEIVTEVAPSDEEEEEEEEEEPEEEEAPAPAPIVTSPALIPDEPQEEENDEDHQAALRAALRSANWPEYIRLKNSRK